MGMRIIGSSALCDALETNSVTTDPDPKKFKINSLFTWGTFLVVEINYPNCTNFEGDKILVFEGLTNLEIQKLQIIDPHFIEGGKLVARFKPTPEGRDMADKFVAAISDYTPRG